MRQSSKPSGWRYIVEQILSRKANFTFTCIGAKYLGKKKELEQQQKKKELKTLEYESLQGNRKKKN